MSEVLALDPARTDNAKLMADCATLGYLDGVVVDVTYNAGRFWRDVPPPWLRFDIDPQWDARVADFRDLPLVAGSVDTVVFDPPYKLNGTSTGAGPSALDDGYGVGGGYRSVGEIHALIFGGIDEAWRVLRVGGLLLLKCQAQQNAGRMNDQPAIFARYAVDAGLWHDVDRLHVITKPRKQPRKQRTARSNISTLVVLRKRGGGR
jgi:hypothetical protein